MLAVQDNDASDADVMTADAAAGGDQAPSNSVDPVQRLKGAQTAVLGNPNYAPKGGTTYCNLATYDVAQRMGVDLSPFESQPGKPALANVQTRQLAATASNPDSGWRRINRNQAQAYANQGKFVVMGLDDPGGHGHTVTVMADSKGDPGNPTMAQIGGGKYRNGRMPLSKSIASTRWDHVGTYVYDPH